MILKYGFNFHLEIAAKILDVKKEPKKAISAKKKLNLNLITNYLVMYMLSIQIVSIFKHFSILVFF